MRLITPSSRARKHAPPQAGSHVPRALAVGAYAQPFKGFHKAGHLVYLDNPFWLTREEWLQPKVAKRRYEQHNAEVRRTVPASRLLVYSVDQGWAPLCKFLKKPVPTQDFPHMNDTAALRRVALVLRTLGVLLPILPFVVGFLLT